MNCESTVNRDIRAYISQSQQSQNTVRGILLEMDAVNLLLKYLYSILRNTKMRKADLYKDFFEAPFVKSYLDRHGLESPTEEGGKRRVPFLINILDALGIISQTNSEIEVLSFIASKEVLRFDPSEKDDVVYERIANLKLFEEKGANNFSADEISKLKETFGPTFLTKEYYLTIIQI